MIYSETIKRNPIYLLTETTAIFINSEPRSTLTTATECTEDIRASNDITLSHHILWIGRDFHEGEDMISVTLK